MESVAVLVYRIVEKEFIEDSEAMAKQFVKDRYQAVTVCGSRVFKLVKSVTIDAGKKHSDQTTYRLHVALGESFRFQRPFMM